MYSSSFPFVPDILLNSMVAVDTVVGSTLIVNRPLVNMDMNTFAACTNTDPNTCFDASKNHILTGRCGLSRQRLYTSDNKARAPRASCTNNAKDPNRRHSPFSPSSAFGEPIAIAAAVAFAAAVAKAVAAVADVVVVVPFG